MTPKRFIDPMPKRLARQAFGGALAVHNRLSLLGRRSYQTPKLFFGGARGGGGGGPRVKVAKLTEAFGEHPWSYNLLYMLSNTPYLSGAALARVKGRGIAVVSNQNGVFFPAWFDGDWRARNARMAEQHKLADHVFYQSDFCRRAAEKFLGPRRGPSEILFNAVDTEVFRPPAVVPRSQPFRYLIMGKIGDHQAYRITTCIEALNRARARGLPGELLIAGIIGTGARSEAERLAAKLGLATQVHWQGPYSQQTAPSIYQSAHAYLMTNHLDACPSTVIEAMACGLPVIHVSSGGAPELVGPEAGAAVPTGESWTEVLHPDPGDLAEAMIKITQFHPGLADAARVRAVEMFDIRKWLDRHRTLFRALLEARQ